jgi:tRNA-modifying protein YgfZ
MSTAFIPTADLVAQTRALLHGAALVDASAHQSYVVTGKHRVDLIQRISSNDVKKLNPGEGHANCFTTNKGRIVDWVRVFVKDDAVLLITSPGNGEHVVKWLDRYTITEDFKLREVTDDVALLHVVGPAAATIVGTHVASGGAAAVRDAKPFSVMQGRVGAHDLQVIRTEGLTTAPGFLLFCERAQAPDIATALLILAEPDGLVACGPQAFDAARIHEGLPLFARELGEEFHPLEAGLWGSVSFTKGCYVGQEVIARLNTYDKVMKQLARLVLSSGAGLTTPMKLFANGQDAGVITSLAGPPLLDEWRALGYVKKRALQSGAPIVVGAPDATITARVLDPIKL